MPILDCLNGVKIYVYNGEHRPPHIHAVYNEFSVLIEIQTGEVYSGLLPPRQMKIVYDWLSGNSDWALEAFYELNPELQ